VEKIVVSKQKGKGSKSSKKVKNNRPRSKLGEAWEKKKSTAGKSGTSKSPAKKRRGKEARKGGCSSKQLKCACNKTYVITANPRDVKNEGARKEKENAGEHRNLRNDQETSRKRGKSPKRPNTVKGRNCEANAEFAGKKKCAGEIRRQNRRAATGGGVEVGSKERVGMANPPRSRRKRALRRQGMRTSPP